MRANGRRMTELSTAEAEAILTLCLMASFADGEKHERERQQIKRLAETVGGGDIDVFALYQKVLLQRPSIPTVAAGLETEGARQLAYEMAVAVCDADDICSPQEKSFLQELKQGLGLGAAATVAIDREADALSTVPLEAEIPKTAEVTVLGASAAVPAGISDEETNGMILRYAILAGALELLPQSLATLAIVPLQTKMVYRIGSQRGVAADKRSIAELMGAVGIGLASQVFEGFARKLTKGLFRQFAGKLGGSISSTATGMAMSFATTYALGQVAKIYYESGRSLSLTSLKEKFPSLIEQGKTLAQKYSGQIAEKSQQLKGADLTSLVNGNI